MDRTFENWKLEVVIIFSIIIVFSSPLFYLSLSLGLEIKKCNNSSKPKLL